MVLYLSIGGLLATAIFLWLSYNTYTSNQGKEVTDDHGNTYTNR